MHGKKCILYTEYQKVLFQILFYYDIKRRMKMSKKTTVLMILDGYGLNEKTEHNAVAIGKTPLWTG